MQAPGPHPREAERLAALRALGLLDTGPEPRFDALTRTACRLFGVRTALISLVDEDRSWFKSRVGLDPSEIQRNVSFCGHAILGDRVFAVEDASRDERFSDNPLVTGELHLRFYAGQVLRTVEGLPVGTLCLLDDSPRILTLEEKAALEDLALLAEAELIAQATRLSGEGQLRSMLGAMTEGMVLQEASGIIVSSNPAAERILGLTKDQLEGRDSVDSRWRAIHEDGSPWPGDAHPAMLALRSKQPQVGKIMGVHKPDGELAWIFINSMPVLNGAGAVQGVSTTFLDITALKARETALRESESRFRLLAERTTDILARHAPDGSFLFITPSVTAILGYTPEELQGRLPTLFLVEEDIPVMQAAHIGLLRGKQMEPFRFRARHKDGGRVVWLEAAGNSVSDPVTGAVVETIITSRDITERVRGEEALRESEFRSRALIQALPDLIFVVHRDGTQLEVYAKEGHTLRRPVADMLGVNLREVMPADLVEERLARIARVLDSGQMEIYEAQVGEGEERQDHETRVVPCGYDRVMLIVRNITERKALDRLKGEFVSTVSHELRTPLTAIRGALGLLLGGVAGTLTPQVNDLLTMGQKNVERLVLLINDLLDLEKLDKGQINFFIQELDLGNLLASILVGLQPMAEGLGVTLGLGPPHLESHTLADPDRLTQVLVNLVGNALKFSPRGDRVEVRLLEQGPWVRVEVEDRGPGIPDAFRARIFQRFAQADGTDSREKGGTGLGLSIAKGFVERMGGTLGYESRPGRTVFWVDLPRAPALKFPP